MLQKVFQNETNCPKWSGCFSCTIVRENAEYAVRIPPASFLLWQKQCPPQCGRKVWAVAAQLDGLQDELNAQQDVLLVQVPDRPSSPPPRATILPGFFFVVVLSNPAVRRAGNVLVPCPTPPHPRKRLQPNRKIQRGRPPAIMLDLAKHKPQTKHRPQR